MVLPSISMSPCGQAHGQVSSTCQSYGNEVREVSEQVTCRFCVVTLLKWLKSASWQWQCALLSAQVKGLRISSRCFALMSPSVLYDLWHLRLRDSGLGIQEWWKGNHTHTHTYTYTHAYIHSVTHTCMCTCIQTQFGILEYIACRTHHQLINVC